MKKLFLFVCILLAYNNLSAQQDYTILFKKAINSVEMNYSGFADKTENNQNYYDFYKTQLLSDTLKTSQALEKQLDLYLSFFKDKHLKRNSVDIMKFLSDGNYQREKFNFQNIDKNTCYLKLPHFRYKQLVDSLVESSIDTILRKRNLIIDLRGNSGGMGASCNALLPLIATNEIFARNIEFLATKENWEFVKNFADIGDWKEKQNNKFIPAPWTDATSNNEYSSVYKIENGINEYPKCVAVLIDRKVGSAAEEFVFCAKQSFKVKVFGENSRGAYDYSNCRPFVLLKDSIYIQAPTTRTKGLPINAIDNHGIVPDFLLKKGNQVEQILQYFQSWN